MDLPSPLPVREIYLKDVITLLNTTVVMNYESFE